MKITPKKKAKEVLFRNWDKWTFSAKYHDGPEKGYDIQAVSPKHTKPLKFWVSDEGLLRYFDCHKTEKDEGTLEGVVRG